MTQDSGRSRSVGALPAGSNLMSHPGPYGPARVLARRGRGTGVEDVAWLHGCRPPQPAPPPGCRPDAGRGCRPRTAGCGAKPQPGGGLQARRRCTCACEEAPACLAGASLDLSIRSVHAYASPLSEAMMRQIVGFPPQLRVWPGTPMVPDGSSGLRTGGCADTMGEASAVSRMNAPDFRLSESAETLPACGRGCR